MPEGSKYQNQFTFNNKVGNVNTGDVTIQGDQIGIQNNSSSEKTLAESAKDIQDLLSQLSQDYPNITEAEQQEFIDNWMQAAQTYPIQTEADQQSFTIQFDETVRTNSRIRKILLAGGIELIKLLCPPLGIPIEMGMRWLETAERNRDK